MQLFVALALGEDQEPVTLRKLVQGRLDVGQQRAVALEQMRTDSLDLLAQAVVTCGRQVSSRLMQRNHVRPAAVAVCFDQPEFGAAHGGVNLVARDAEGGVADGRSEEIKRLEKMDIGIPERVVGVEDEIQRLSRRRRHPCTEYRRAPRQAIGAGMTPAPRDDPGGFGTVSMME